MKLRAKNRKISIILAVLIGSFAVLMVGIRDIPAKAQTSALDVEIVVGYHNYVKYGSYAPVNVKISENKNKMGGTVELLLVLDQSEQYSYIKEFPAGREESEISFYVPIPQYYENNSYMEVKIIDENGAEIYQSRVGYQGNNQGAQIYIGVLTDQYEGMEYWDELQLQEPYQIGGCTIPLSAGDIAVESQSLEMLDMILVKNFSENQLSAGQKNSLEDWIYGGGVLLVEGNELFQEYGNSAVESVTYPFLQPNQYGGTITVKQMGKGRIVRTDFDTNMFSYIIKNEGESLEETFQTGISSDELLEILMGKSCIQGIFQEGYRGMNQMHALINETISADGVTIPSFGWYILILGLYIFIFVPVCYMILRKRKHMEWLRLTIVILAFIGSGVIFLTGKNTRFSEPFIHYIAVDEYWGNKKTETIYVTLQAPDSKAYEVLLNPSYQTFPILEQWGYMRDTERTEEITVSSSEYKVRFTDSTAFQEEHFRMRKTEETEEMIETTIHLFDGKTTGRLENKTNKVLEDVVLFLPEYALEVGDMEPGEIIDLDELTSTGYDTGNLKDMWAFSTRSGHLRMMDEKHFSMMQNYLWNNYEKSPCVIGFVKETDANIQTDDGYEQYGERMLVTHVDIDMTEDGWEYFPNVPMNSRIVTGNFYGTYDSTMEGDSGVIAYTIDGEYEIKELKFHVNSISQQTEKNVNEIYFLNPLTGEYTLVYPGNSTFSGEMLQDYINMNEIYIKFRSTAENGEISRLPRISMIGRKRDVGN